MTIGGAFLGGGVELVPAGSCKLVLEIHTEDGKNLATTFSVVGGGQTYTATAGADGRAELTVPSGVTYTVTTSATGYDGLTAQTVIGDSATIQYVRFEATLPRVKKSGDTMTGNLTIGGVAYIPSGLIVPASDDGKRTRMAFRGVGGQNGDRIMMLIDNNQSYAPITILSNLTAPKITIGDNNVPPYSVTPADKTDNSTRIATTAWVNTASSVAHTAGNETISGDKTFNNLLQTGNFAIYGNDSTGRLPIVLRPFGPADQKNVGLLIDNDTAYQSLYMTATKEDPFIKIGSGNVKAYATTTPQDASMDEIATANWCNSKFIQSSGGTMTGVLFITRGLPQLYLKNTSDDYTVAFTDSTPVTLKFLGFHDKNSKDTFHISEYIYNGGRGVSIQLSDASSGSVKSANIGLTAEKSGATYATAPTPPSTSDNSTKIATTAWINSANVICRTAGNQTIGGEKVFTTRPIVQTGLNSGLIVKSTDFDRTATFTTWTRPFHIVAYDKNGQYVSIIQSYADQNNKRNLDLILYTASGNQQTLGIRYDEASKVGYGVAPTTPSTATANEIATAGWVLDKVPKKTTFSTWAELNALLVNGKPGDMMCITLDYVGNSNITDFTADDVNIHAFGSFTVEELTVSSGTLTKLEAFGGGEIQYNNIRDRYFAMTGFGQLSVGDLTAWAFRVPYGGEMNLMLMADSSVTSCTGFYVSI